jgi:hypothetical protein
MKKGGLILLLGLVLGAASFFGFYYLGTASCRDMINRPQPELAWLKKEFNLDDAEFSRVSQLHEAYLPRCAERCRRIELQNQKLQELLRQTTTVTSEIKDLLVERGKMRAACEAEMLGHFIEVSRTMPPEQGRRYLAWAEQQLVLNGQGMEQRHHRGMGHSMGQESPQ